MCGICGILNFDTLEKVDPGILGRMNQTMVHRGPDDSGIYHNGSIGLAHRRLSIVDLNTGHQPMFNENGKVCIVFNGEIYNHDELRRELQSRGHQFRTRSDTEAIIHCYEEHGNLCVKKLRGMFAFAIWDMDQRKLFLARDRLGIKPLYYFCDQKSIVFASEIKAIIASGYVSPEVNIGMLDSYLTLGYVPGPETLFKGIYKLLPGHTMHVQNNQVLDREYWDLAYIYPEPISENDCCEIIQELLHDCVKMRLMSDVPLGAFLSGGVDSSAVVAMMAKDISQVKTFSIGYKDAEKQNELNYARIVADAFNTDHHEFVLEPRDFFKSISDLLYYLEEPIVEAPAIALYHISKLAREHATVLLSGEGADEIFGGYAIYQKMRSIERLRLSIPFTHINFPGRALSALNFNDNTQKYLDWLFLPFEKRYFGVSCDITSSTKQRLYSEMLMSQNNSVEGIFSRYYNKVKHLDRIGQMLYVDTKIWLPDDLLTKADKMTMATSVELRVPFLDHKFVEFAASIPSDFKVRGKANKYIMKKALEGILPEKIIYREKRGFPVPIKQWFSSDIYIQAKEVLLDPLSLKRGYFNESCLDDILTRQKDGKVDYSRRILSLLILELWHQSFIDSDIKQMPGRL